MTEPAKLAKHDVETQLIELCWKDPAFKAELLADPKAKLEALLGLKLPEQLTVVVYEDDATTLNFTLPPTPATLQGIGELSDADLDQVAAGGGWGCDDRPLVKQPVSVA